MSLSWEDGLNWIMAWLGKCQDGPFEWNIGGFGSESVKEFWLLGRAREPSAGSCCWIIAPWLS